MIHVPDVRRAVEWYQAIGFDVTATYGDGDDGLSFAMLSFGSGEVMFSSGGRPGSRHRREVDLYVYADDVDALYARLKDRIEVIQGPHDMFHGMREVIVRDLNGFWITFGETSPGEALMSAVGAQDADGVRAALRRGALSPQRLSVALGTASAAGAGSLEIVHVLEQAGAVRPPVVPLETLREFAGTYTGEDGLVVRVTLEDGQLLACPTESPCAYLVPTSSTTFTPLTLDDASVTFDVSGGKSVALTFTQGPQKLRFRRTAAGV